MKAKVHILILAGLVGFQAAGFAQDTPPATGEQPPAVIAPVAATPADSEPAVAPATSAPADTTPAADPNAVLTAVSIDDQPLTDAIKILARQASLNYLMDPKVAFGVPGADGKVIPQPNVSIRWENVTAQQALEALLNNYNLQLIEDPKTRIARITAKDPAAPDPLVTRIMQLAYANPSNMVTAVQSTLSDKRSKVLGDFRTSQLVVVATEKEQEAVDALLVELDKPTRQVLIEARLMEISRNPKTVKGIDWSGTLEAQKVTFGNGVTTATTTTTTPGLPTAVTLPGGRTITSTPRSSSATKMTTESGNGGVSLNTFNGFTPNIGFLNADGLSATLSFLNSDADTQVISTPRTVTLDNEPAVISVIRAVPIFQQSTVGVGGGGTSTATKPEYTNMGTIFTVTPRISANNQVRLKVVPEVSSIFTTVTRKLNGQENQADVYDIRKIETQVLIPSSHTLVLGGLINDEIKNAYNKVPLLGDIPVLGLAFRYENKSRDKRNLLIFITPTILNDADFTPTTTDFLKSKPQEISGGIDPSSAWDSAKPKDWSNPEGTSPQDAIFNENLVAPK